MDFEKWWESEGSVMFEGDCSAEIIARAAWRSSDRMLELSQQIGEIMGIVKIKKPWETISDQKVTGDKGNVWMVTDIIARAKDLPVKEIPMDYINLDCNIGGIPVRKFVSHMKLVLDADMKYPIILDEDAALFDGRHRVAKALLEEHETIKARRFEEDPPATYTEKTEK